MRKIKVPESFRKSLIDISKEKNLFMEGNLLKILDPEDDLDFKQYIDQSIESDKEQRRKRLKITKQIQENNKELRSKQKEIEEQNTKLTESQKEIELQNSELKERQAENVSLMDELKNALETAENAKAKALDDLSLVQQKTQFELMSMIVKTALVVIMSIGIISTTLYGYAIFYSSDEVDIIGNTWSNLFGILLTNSFSIIGTIMGIKYTNESKENSKK